ncbi:MAG: RNA polymerase sigma factor [Candidatus Hydrogenedentes bacterium]|nr:RNA polymerase sigma factor [Candidatus Hydrogenedentota bacterium]
MELSTTYTGTENAGPSDEVLMARVKAGDDDALAALLRRYEQALFHYARQMLGNAADAEDIFQETFLRVHLHRRRFWGNALFKPWVYRIATNLCKDRLRYRQRRPEVQPGNDEDRPDVLDNLPSAISAPDDVASAKELAARMSQALASLNVKHRAVFLMAHQEGMSYAEIARALRIPAGTVKSRMNKAVSQLMAVLESSKS